jgi:hypothetical protein
MVNPGEGVNFCVLFLNLFFEGGVFFINMAQLLTVSQTFGHDQEFSGQDELFEIVIRRRDQIAPSRDNNSKNRFL